MRKSNLFLSTVLIFISANLLICKSSVAQTWVTTLDSVLSLTYITQADSLHHPIIPTYQFSTPTEPTMFDTLNFKFYYYFTTDSAVSFQVLEHQYAQFDSTQTDTLGFVVSSFLSSTNSVLTSSQNIGISNGFKGIEICTTYNDVILNKISISYMRLYYYKNLMLTFSISAYQADLSQLNTNKSLFFNSISFPQPLSN